MVEMEMFLILIFISLAVFAATSGLVWLIGPVASIILFCLIGGAIIAAILRAWEMAALWVGLSFVVVGSTVSLLYYYDVIGAFIPQMCGAFYAAILAAKLTNATRWYHYVAAVTITLAFGSIMIAAEQERQAQKAAREAARAKAAEERCERPILGRVIKLIGGCPKP